MQIWQNFQEWLDQAFGRWISQDALISVLSFLVILVLLTAVKVLLNTMLRKRIFKGKELLKATVNWLYYLAVFILIPAYFSRIELLSKTVFSIGDAEISAMLPIVAAFIFLLFLKLSSLIRKHVLPPTYERYQVESGTRFTLNRIFHYFILVFAILISLNALGINITSLTIFAGVFGVGLGFGLQNIVSNFVSGIILLFERPIRVGDRVVLDGIVGEIIEIKIRATIVKTLDNEHLIVPNSFFLEEKITNRSYGDLNIRTTIDVGVSYASDVRLVEQLLLRAVQTISERTGSVLDEPEPLVRFTAFGDSSLNFKLFVWVENLTNVYYVKSELHFEILKLFRENDVEIPFPQRDLHMKT